MSRRYFGPPAFDADMFAEYDALLSSVVETRPWQDPPEATPAGATYAAERRIGWLAAGAAVELSQIIVGGGSSGIMGYRLSVARKVTADETLERIFTVVPEHQLLLVQRLQYEDDAVPDSQALKQDFIDKWRADPSSLEPTAEDTEVFLTCLALAEN